MFSRRGGHDPPPRHPDTRPGDHLPSQCVLTRPLCAGFSRSVCCGRSPRGCPPLPSRRLCPDLDGPGCQDPRRLPSGAGGMCVFGVDLEVFLGACLFPVAMTNRCRLSGLKQPSYYLSPRCHRFAGPDPSGGSGENPSLFQLPETPRSLARGPVALGPQLWCRIPFAVSGPHASLFL